MTGITILNVPEVALEKILSYLSNDEIATNRLVCKQFNIICGGLLTKGFIQLEKKHAQIYKSVRALLPRRPSERRSNVVVSRYCEILHGMESRIRMLSMTYMRYIEQHLICFVPGKVLDEISLLLHLIESKFDPPQNNNQLLEELRDLSSMAMEHFDEHIMPRLEKREEVIQYKNVLPPPIKSPVDDMMQKEFKKLHKRNRIFKSQLAYLITRTRRISEKWYRQHLRVKQQSSIIKEQNAKLQVQATRIENHEMIISEMSKKFEELQTNFVEIKSKWEMEVIQNTTHVQTIQESPIKEATPEIESSALSKNIRRMIQYENMRQRSGVRRKLNNRTAFDNRPATIKPRTPKLKTDDTKRRRYKSMVDVDIWRHRCPTSRLSYSVWHRNYSRNKSNDSDISMQKEQSISVAQPSTSEGKNSRKASDFHYKSIIKQRASRVFPLTCLDLDRKRKSYLSPDVPSKLSKNEANSSLNTLDLINKYLQEPGNSNSSEVGIRKPASSRFGSNTQSLKRKQDRRKDA